jgi:hypothetical protein
MHRQKHCMFVTFPYFYCSSCCLHFFRATRLSNCSLCRQEEVRKLFEKFGEVRDVYLPRDYYTRHVVRGRREGGCQTGQACKPLKRTGTGQE